MPLSYIGEVIPNPSMCYTPDNTLQELMENNKKKVEWDLDKINGDIKKVIT